MILDQIVNWMETASQEQRAQAAVALVKAWSSPKLTHEHRESAEAAMTCILDDPDEQVRLAFAEALTECPDAPRHLALALAGDTVEVSLPILRYSSVLLDGELMVYVAQGCEEQHVAIASRSYTSQNLCTYLANHAAMTACLALVTNPSAKLTQKSFHTIAERFGEYNDLRRCLLARDDIGMAARILLIEKYAMSLIEQDDSSTSKSTARRKDEMREVCDKATITFAAQVSSIEIAEIVAALIQSERLTTSFLLRAICMGNITLFAEALTQLSKQPLHRVESVLRDNRANALKAIYDRADLPASALGVFQSAIQCWKNVLSQNLDVDHERLPYLVTKQVLNTYVPAEIASGKTVDKQVVDELLLLLRKICTDAARDSARHHAARQKFLLAQAEAQRALPAPEVFEGPELNEEELLTFAVHLADELAQLAIENEIAVQNAADRVIPANEQDSMLNRIGSSQFDQRDFKKVA